MRSNYFRLTLNVLFYVFFALRLNILAPYGKRFAKKTKKSAQQITVPKIVTRSGIYFSPRTNMFPPSFSDNVRSETNKRVVFKGDAGGTVGK